MNDPIADEVASLLDGQIMLSRDLQQQGHYPAVDPLRSISRCMDQVAEKEQVKEALEIKLVDELVDSPVIDVALKRAREWASIPEKGRVASKVMLRGAMIQDLEEKREMDVGWFRDFIMEEGVQKGIEGYLKSLSKK